MEWVETTGSTLEEAKEAALDQLGVDDADAEFEILEQPRAGLFGRIRGEARVRARVRPTAPRAKEDRRDRRRRRNGERASASASAPASALAEPTGSETAAATGASNGEESGRPATSNDGESQPGQPGSPSQAARSGSGRRRRQRGRAGSDRAGGGQSSDQSSSDRIVAPAASKESRSSGDIAELGEDRANAGQNRHYEREGTVEVSLEEQGQVAQEFLGGLASEFGLAAAVKITADDENVNLDLSGSELGLLIGPKGATLLAIQDLTRTVVHHKTGASNGRVNVDVGGYRQKRSEALARFANQVALKVKESGVRTALEPMAAADRKVVHDSLTDVEGVSTMSEGEEPRRRVVIVPSGD